MPTISVNDDGAVLYYTDSGIPSDSADYATIILIHGYMFHSATFTPVLAHAAAHNLRLVTVNQRDYSGSSPLNDRELADVLSPEPERQAVALREWGLEFAAFIARFIEKENIAAPKCVDGGKTVGGVSILGWSQGVAPLLAILANVETMETSTSALLEQYVRTVFMYDPPLMILGIPSPPSLPGPLDDPSSATPESFITYITTQYAPLSDPSDITLSALLSRHSLATANPRPDVYPNMEEIEREGLVSPEIIPRAGMSIMWNLEVYEASLERALTLEGGGGRWDHVKMVGVWPDRTAWTCTLASRVVHDMMVADADEKAGDARPKRRVVENVRLRDANHFHFRKHPEEFVRFLASYV